MGIGLHQVPNHLSEATAGMAGASQSLASMTKKDQKQETKPSAMGTAMSVGMAGMAANEMTGGAVGRGIRGLVGSNTAVPAAPLTAAGPIATGAAAPTSAGIAGGGAAVADAAAAEAAGATAVDLAALQTGSAAAGGTAAAGSAAGGAMAGAGAIAWPVAIGALLYSILS